MNLIVAADSRWAIGKEGHLLVTIPADQQLFRRETMGKAVVMGRKTLESLPGARPLENRTNIVLTTDRGYQARGAELCHSMEEALALLRHWRDEDIYVIGGESIYRQFLPWCQNAHVTKIDYVYDGDTYFPALDQDPAWELAEESEEQTYFDLCYTFQHYKRRNG